MTDKLIKVLLVSIILFFGAHNLHDYVRDKHYEEHGWIMLLTAIFESILAADIWFN